MMRLGTDRNHAGTKYEAIRRQLIKYFYYSSCLDPEQLADEVFDRVTEKLVLDEVKIHNIGAFLWGIARNIRLEALRKSSRIIYLSDLSDVESLPTINPVVYDDQIEACENKKPLNFLQESIHQIPAKDRKLLLEYYSPQGHRAIARQLLAQKNGMTLRTLRVRITRLKFKLRKHMGECLVDSGARL